MRVFVEKYVNEEVGGQSAVKEFWLADESRKFVRLLQATGHLTDSSVKGDIARKQPKLISHCHIDFICSDSAGRYWHTDR